MNDNEILARLILGNLRDKTASIAMLRNLTLFIKRKRTICSVNCLKMEQSLPQKTDLCG
ncbi:MAG: hypothetical protein J1E98_00505 [Lachnospiraceae bacterium]|nr:hypothetical protein [Lachnospiraceae bacterium]